VDDEGRATSSPSPPNGARRPVRKAHAAGARLVAARALLDGFKQHDLLTYSSAISFQIALAIATGACFILAAVCLVLAPFFAVRHPGPAWDVFAFLARWALAMGFLSLAVGLLVHQCHRAQVADMLANDSCSRAKCWRM
jgi:hypothetical protein